QAATNRHSISKSANHCCFRFLNEPLIMKNKFLSCTLLAALLVSTIQPALAQSPQPSASPTATPTLTVDNSPTATMTFPDGSSLNVQSQSGRFPLVAGCAGQSINIELGF